MVMKKNKMLCAVLAAGLTVSSVAFFSSCQKDESVGTPTERFLDLDLGVVNGQMSETQM